VELEGRGMKVENVRQDSPLYEGSPSKEGKLHPHFANQSERKEGNPRHDLLSAERRARGHSEGGGLHFVWIRRAATQKSRREKAKTK